MSCCEHCEPEPRARIVPRGWLLAAAALALGAGLLVQLSLDVRVAAWALYVASALLSGPDTLRSAYNGLRRGRIGMSFLMSLAAVGAFAIGHGEEGAAVLLLFALAEELERYAERRSHASVAGLLELAPRSARVRRGNDEAVIDAGDVAAGETVLLRSGDRVPLDGTVTAGAAAVDEAAITGESLPAERAAGSTVFAGSIVREGYLEMEVTHVRGATVLDRVVELVEEARQRRSGTERFVDSFARVYTPVVVALAATVALAPPLLGFGTFSDWLYRGLVLLVTACPCALAISTPVSFVSALSAGARSGVLIKGSEVLERLVGVRVVAFDKTGTLTEGRIFVRDVRCAAGEREGEMLRAAAAVEARSSHPVAEAIVRLARERDVGVGAVSEFRSTAGRGAEGVVDGAHWIIGSRAFLQERGIPVSTSPKEEDSATVVVARDGEIVAEIAVADRVRPAAAEVVAALRRAGLATAMLTGDTESTARSIAAASGVDHVEARLLPEDKLRAVERLRARFGSVLVVGDGVNDAPALAEADVGVAMGAAGSDVALETADVALMGDELERLPWLLALGPRTLRVVRQNIAVALGVKGAIAVLAVLGYVSLWVAVALGDMGLSLAVILNALRLGRVTGSQSSPSPPAAPVTQPGLRFSRKADSPS